MKRPNERRAAGFTLVEVLIVISIIAILASLALTGVSVMKRKGNNAAIQLEISNLSNAIDQYYSEEGSYPGAGKKITSESNHFPDVLDALIGEPRPKGPGGRSAPYLVLKTDRLVVVDEDADDSERTVYRPATNRERRDPKTKKYYLDYFNEPYVYRCNRGQRVKDWMRREKKFDLYSKGENGEDETALGEEMDEESDDIGNW